MPQRPLQPAGERARGAVRRELEERLCAARRETGWGPRLIAGVTGVPHQTVSNVLKRAGCSRRPKQPREAARAVRVALPRRSAAYGHQALRALHTAQATPSPATAPAAARRYAEQVGYEYAHAIIDDHTRLAYSELHPDQRADTVVAFTRRALAWYAGARHHRQARDDRQRVDLHQERHSGDLPAERGVRHLTIPAPPTPTNGKVERFHQTMAREWGYGLTYRSSTHRAQALPHWLDHYNGRRPHSSLGDRPPISRVRNV